MRLELSTSKVLCVTEDESAARILAKSLQHVGVRQPRRVSTSGDALLAVGSFQPDIIIVDADLPFIPGAVLLKKLRSMPGCADYRGILMLARLERKTVAQACAAGIVSVLRKPIDQNRTFHALTQAAQSSEKLILNGTYFGPKSQDPSGAVGDSPPGSADQGRGDKNPLSTGGGGVRAGVLLKLGKRAAGQAAAKGASGGASGGGIGGAPGRSEEGGAKFIMPDALPSDQSKKGKRGFDDESLLEPGSKQAQGGGIDLAEGSVGKEKSIEKAASAKAKAKAKAVSDTEASEKPGERESVEKEDKKEKEEDIGTQATIDEMLENHEAWLTTVGAEGERADLTGIIFSRINLEEADLTRATLVNAVFSKGNCKGLVARRADISGARFDGANLVDADFAAARANGANFSDAKMTGANLLGCNLVEAILVNADLRRADLSSANLSDANFCGADLRGALGIRQDQIPRMKVDKNTRLPAGLSLD